MASAIANPEIPQIETLGRDSWISLDRTTMSKGFSAELTLADLDDQVIDRSKEPQDDDNACLMVPPSDRVRRPRRGAMGPRGSSAEMVAESIYEKNLSSCSWVAPSKVKDIPMFAPEEVKTGTVLGSGCFGCVWEVKGFALMDGEDEGASPSKMFRFRKRRKQPKQDDSMRDMELDQDEIESRNFIAKHCYRKNGDARYALKRLKTATLEDETGFINGMNDLATETLFLSAIRNHPNVIKLRGVATENMFSRDYFLILDRLYDTLQVRILKWKRKRKRANAGFAGPLLREKRRAIKDQIVEAQMKYGMDLAAAIAYIHEHRIMHRDLKPTNIGFDIRDDIKIFDFGLAKEMPQSLSGNMDETYHFTAAGTPRYMAPEIGMGEPYNQACDIYSFALVFWEMLAMCRPYPKENTVTLLEENVWSPDGPQRRPPLNPKMNLNVQKILHQAWHGNYKHRPNATNLLDALTNECLKIRKSMRVSHTSRRSTFVFGREDSSNQSWTMQSLESGPPSGPIFETDAHEFTSNPYLDELYGEMVSDAGSDNTW